MSEPPGFPQDIDEARLDAELTRQELGETAQELVNRVKDTSQQVAFNAAAAFGVAIILLLALRKLLRRK